MSITEFRPKEFENKNYLKICVNKAHRGPISVDKLEAKKANLLSASANRIRIAADFSISHSSTEGDKESKKTGFKAKSYVFSAASDKEAAETAKQAIAYMQVWDDLFGTQGTKEFEKKLAEFVKAQAQVYSELGINPASGKRPNLTADQRAVYNAAVGPYGFDYFEYHLAYKQVGLKRMIRSTTYRSLEPLDIDAVTKKLEKAADEYLSSVTIEAKSTN